MVLEMVWIWFEDFEMVFRCCHHQNIGIELERTDQWWLVDDLFGDYATLYLLRIIMIQEWGTPFLTNQYNMEWQRDFWTLLNWGDTMLKKEKCGWLKRAYWRKLGMRRFWPTHSGLLTKTRGGTSGLAKESVIFIINPEFSRDVSFVGQSRKHSSETGMIAIGSKNGGQQDSKMFTTFHWYSINFGWVIFWGVSHAILLTFFLETNADVSGSKHG